MAIIPQINIGDENAPAYVDLGMTDTQKIKLDGLDVGDKLTVTKNMRDRAAMIGANANYGYVVPNYFLNNPSDTVNGAPWYGLGKSSTERLSGETPTATQRATQVGGYYGVSLKTKNNDLFVPHTGALQYNNECIVPNAGCVIASDTADWNAYTKPGVVNLLMQSVAPNGPGFGGYCYLQNYEYNGSATLGSGTGNITQMAIPYYDAGNNGIYLRSRYNGTWSAWGKVGGGGGAWEQIGRTTNFGGAPSVEFTNLNAYSELYMAGRIGTTSGSASPLVYINGSQLGTTANNKYFRYRIMQSTSSAVVEEEYYSNYSYLEMFTQYLSAKVNVIRITGNDYSLSTSVDFTLLGKK